MAWPIYRILSKYIISIVEFIMLMHRKRFRTHFFSAIFQVVLAIKNLNVNNAHNYLTEFSWIDKNLWFKILKNRLNKTYHFRKWYEKYKKGEFDQKVYPDIRYGLKANLYTFAKVRSTKWKYRLCGLGFRDESAQDIFFKLHSVQFETYALELKLPSILLRHFYDVECNYLHKDSQLSVPRNIFDPIISSIWRIYSVFWIL